MHSAVDFTRSLTLEELLVTPVFGFGLDTATPLQRAIMRIADGRSVAELMENPEVREAYGAQDTLTKAPKHLVVVSGIRGAKTLMGSCIAFYATQHVDVSHLKPGEVPRVSIVSLTTDLAKVAFSHIVGQLTESPVLQKFIAKEPTNDTITVFHPTGRMIEIKVVAGARAGSSLAARWSCGVIFDEAPRMSGADEAVVNFDDAFQNSIGRLLPGASITSIGSPWAPYGPIFDLVTERWREPKEDVVVIKAPGWAMNPFYWTEARCEEMRISHPDAYTTDCAAEFSQPEENLLGLDVVSKYTRKYGDIAPEQGRHYTAGMDPATRANAWSFVICSREGNRRRVDFVREWRRTKTAELNPRTVLAEIAAICKAYGITTIHSDQWSIDFLKELARDYELTILQASWTQKRWSECALAFKNRLDAGAIELHPDPVFQRDLLMVKKQPSSKNMTIRLPHTGDGRHCDYVPALLIAMNKYLVDIDAPVVELTHTEAAYKEVEQFRKQLERKVRAQNRERQFE